MELGIKMFASGALVFDMFAFLVAPFWGLDVDPIEPVPTVSPVIPSPQKNTHPAYK
jgi:hypothetical protein